MAIYFRKCWKDEGCRDCIEACHRLHNVPNMGTLKEEIKWIWKTPYEKVFPEHELELAEEDYQQKPVMTLCNHCDDPPASILPDPGHLETGRRDCHDGFSPVHRVPLLHGGLSLRVAKFQLEGSAAFHQERNPGISDEDPRVVEKCNFCVERLAQGLIPACVEACKEKAWCLVI